MDQGERAGPDYLTDCRGIRLKLISALRLARYACGRTLQWVVRTALRRQGCLRPAVPELGAALGIDVGYFIYEGVELSGGVTYLNTDSLTSYKSRLQPDMF